MVEIAVAETDGAPIVNGRRFCISQRGGDHFEIRKLAGRALDHLLEIRDLEFRVMLIQAFDFESERGGEIFFVAQHDID